MGFLVIRGDCKEELQESSGIAIDNGDRSLGILASKSWDLSDPQRLRKEIDRSPTDHQGFQPFALFVGYI